MRKQLFSLKALVVLILSAIGLVACGPQNKMKTIDLQKPFQEQIKKNEELKNKDIITGATQVFDKNKEKEQALSQTTQPATSENVAPQTSSNPNFQSSQNLAQRIQYINIKNISQEKSFVEIVVQDVSGDLNDIVFTDNSIIVKKVINGNISDQDGRLTFPIRANVEKNEEKGLLFVNFVEENKRENPSVNAVLRTSQANINILTGVPFLSEESKLLDKQNVIIRFAQLYFMDQQLRDQNKAIVLESQANKVFIQTKRLVQRDSLVARIMGSKEYQSLLLTGSLSHQQDHSTILKISAIPGLTQDQDLQKFLENFDIGIQVQSSLLTTNSFKLFLTGKGDKDDQGFVYNVSLKQPLKDGADFSNVQSGSSSTAPAAKPNFGNVQAGSSSTAPALDSKANQEIQRREKLPKSSQTLDRLSVFKL